MKVLFLLSTTIIVLSVNLRAADDPGGFNGVLWGASQEDVRSNTKASSWQSDPSQNNFPEELRISVYRTQTGIAGYKASVKYYFQENRLFQATVQFTFPELVNFDFNYNVFRSVNEYYTAIRATTIVFVNDIYELLRVKYGKKEPVFKGLDPRFIFQHLDRYVMQERWNLRYYPYDFYLNIVTASYARWDFPHTRVLFSVNIAAPQKRFDYYLSLSSVDMSAPVKRAMEIMRSRGL